MSKPIEYNYFSITNNVGRKLSDAPIATKISILQKLADKNQYDTTSRINFKGVKPRANSIMPFRKSEDSDEGKLVSTPELSPKGVDSKFGDHSHSCFSRPKRRTRKMPMNMSLYNIKLFSN